MKKIYTLVLMSLLVGTSFAQDIHFSQFYASPLTLNPALTGAFNGQYRAAVSYRNQWWKVTESFGAPVYTTYSASFDMIVPPNNCNNSKFAMGLVFYGDNAGDGWLTTYSGMLSLSYHLAVDRYAKHYISLGLQGGVYYKRIFIHDLVFESQLEDLGFNTNLYNGESGFDGKPIINPDVNIGLLWRSSPSDNIRYSLGFTWFHVTKPKESFLNDENNRLDYRFIGHGNLEIDAGDYITIIPSLVYQYQAAAQEYNGGLAVRYLVNEDDDISLLIGAYYRHNDAVVPMIGGRFKGISAAVTYDVNFSKLRAATSSQGSLEISAGYTFGETCWRSKEAYCPAF